MLWNLIEASTSEVEKQRLGSPAWSQCAATQASGTCILPSGSIAPRRSAQTLLSRTNDSRKRGSRRGGARAGSTGTVAAAERVNEPATAKGERHRQTPMDPGSNTGDSEGYRVIACVTQIDYEGSHPICYVPRTIWFCASMQKH